MIVIDDTQRFIIMKTTVFHHLNVDSFALFDRIQNFAGAMNCFLIQIKKASNSFETKTIKNYYRFQQVNLYASTSYNFDFNHQIIRDWFENKNSWNLMEKRT